MKKLIVTLFLFSPLTLIWGDTEKVTLEVPTCDYLKNTQGFLAQDAFDYAYNLRLCELQRPLDQEATDYILSIHEMQGKSVKDLIYSVGNTFCQ